MLTNQEIFDIVINHARTQKCKAQDIDGNCCYRLPDGRMCFLGPLIPDALYTKDFEETSVCTPTSKINALMRSLGYDTEFLADLQAIHDGMSPYVWETAFENLAVLWNLWYKPEDQLITR